MFKIAREFRFSASHIIRSLDEKHPCGRLHGHNYTVELVLEAEQLNEHGFVRDYRELDAFKCYLESTFDYRHLNDILGDDFVTAEHLARHFYEWSVVRWPEVRAVRISDRPGTVAEFCPSPK